MVISSKSPTSTEVIHISVRFKCSIVACARNGSKKFHNFLHNLVRLVVLIGPPEPEPPDAVVSGLQQLRQFGLKMPFLPKFLPTTAEKEYVIETAI